MALPRLAPDQNSIDITFTISAALRPYLTKWYQSVKLENESVQDFILRQLKANALNDYIATEADKEATNLRNNLQGELQSLGNDIEVFKGEL